MIAGIKDLLKLAGITVVCFCAVFVCTFMLNFYIDVQQLKPLVTDQTKPLYDAQIATAKFCCMITGGVLSVIAFIMLVFYVKLYVDGHMKELGILKAMGYSNGKIAVRFWSFGLSVFVGAVAGYAAGLAFLPSVYKSMAIEGLPPIEINYHFSVFAVTVILPTAMLTAFTCLYAMFALKKPVGNMLRGITDYKIKPSKHKGGKERSFLKTACLCTLSSKKMLVFFIAFACFCYSAMVQMGASMEDLVSGTMGIIILLIGVVLAVVIMLLAVTSLLNSNAKNIAVMKSFGYNLKEIFAAVLLGYIPFAALGFAVGTGYQFGLLSFMVNVIFKDVGEVPEYSFNVKVFFITLATFIALYALVIAVLTAKIGKMPIKTITAET